MSPELQRFISEDPIGFEGSDVNLYVYVGNNSINFTDPKGEISQVFAAGVCIGAVVVGLVNWWYWATHPPQECKKDDDCLKKPSKDEPKISGTPAYPPNVPKPQPPRR